MAESIKFIYGTEAEILALTPTSDNWVNRAFYYPEDRTYFYQALDGVMKKYGGGEQSSVGVKLDEKVVGGFKDYIEYGETLEIPLNYQYNGYDLTVDGTINNNGIINIL